MNLLFLIASLECGGAERVCATLCNHWAARGWRVTLATLDDGSRPPFFPLHPSVRHLPLGLQRRSPSITHAILNNLRRVPRLRRLFREVRPDRVVSFIDGTNVLALLASLGTAIPVVVSERVHPAHHAIPLPWRVLRRIVYPAAAAVVVQTGDAATFFPVSWRNHLVVIPNPVPAPEGSPARPAGARRRIVALGRLDPQKGFDLLVEAFASFAESLPEWDLAIFGEGPSRAALEHQVKDRGLEGRIRLPGRVADVAEALGGADLFVLSSRYEGFPNALAEAMAAGVASIAFDCPSGPADLVRDGVDGVLVPPEDIAALARAVADLAADPARRASLASRGREVADRFSVERVARMWETVLSEGAPRSQGT